MMTEELSTIHIGMTAAAESFGFDFDDNGEDTGVGKGASRSIFGSLCTSYPFSSVEPRAEDMAVMRGALDERERVGRRADKDCGEGI